MKHSPLSLKTSLCASPLSMFNLMTDESLWQTDSDPPPMKTKSLTAHITTPPPQNHPMLSDGEGCGERRDEERSAELRLVVNVDVEGVAVIDG